MHHQTQEFTVQSNAEIGFTEGTVDGETYELTYSDTSWPTANGSSYWFLNNVENAPVIDDQSNILLFKTTSEGTNFKVHFTIRAQKVHHKWGLYWCRRNFHSSFGVKYYRWLGRWT